MIAIRLSGRFKEDDSGDITAGKVYIETEQKNGGNFLANKQNYKWLESVVEKFRQGPGGKK